ncbi:MAG: hypothetical protein ACFHU9_02580 [Fluviicola sp.]
MFGFISRSQECEQVLFSGAIKDTVQPQGFYNLMVVNRTSGRGVFGQPNGHFSVYASNGDTISLSVRGYIPVTVIVSADSNCQHRSNYYIEGKAQEIAAVEVRPLKSLQEIKEEREALAMRETRTVTGMEMIQSPITALYQAFSKKERAKRWVAAQEYKDDQRRIVRELLRNYVAYEIIDLSNEEFDEFINFLNLNDSFLKTASEMELIHFIQDKFEHYKLYKEGR